MQIGSDKQIICEPDGSIAIINHLAATTIFGEKITLDDLIAILAAHEVNTHIDTMALEIAVEKSQQTGEPIENVIAARARVNTEIVFEDLQRLDYTDFLHEIDNARKAYDVLSQLRSDDDMKCKVRYIEEGKVICQIVEANEEDIYGRKNKKRKLPLNLKKGDGVTEYFALGIQRFTADRSGYMVVDEKMRVCIVSPFIVSEDKMKLHFAVLPLVRQESARLLLGDLTRGYPERVVSNQAAIDLYSAIERIQLLTNAEDISEHILLAEGKPPVIGVGEIVNILVGAERDSYNADDGLVDFVKTAQYCMVRQGEMLAEVTKAVAGDSGMDVCGKELAPPAIRSRPLVIGQNVKKDETPLKTLLLAEKAGCFVVNNNHVAVTDTLVIDGDVGTRTGNITQGSSVIVSGNITSGFSVECKEDLIVNGSIENGALVKCGRLIVRRGVFTRKGIVQVKTDADIGYIQDAVLRINGDLVVQRYVHNAKVTVRGNLTVCGRGVKGREHGAVMGGRVSVIGNAYIHSLGNENEETFLLCGVDQDMHEQIVKGQAVVSSFQTNIAMLQSQIGIDLSSDNAVEILAKLPSYQKEMIAEKLREIKVLLADIDNYKRKIEELTVKAYAEDMAKVSITISSHVIPRTTLAIGKDVIIVNSRTSGGTARLIKGKLSFSAMY